MLINLTPNTKEIERRKKIALDNNFKYCSQCDDELVLETGIYRSSCDFNFPEDEFLEKIDGFNYNNSRLKKGEDILDLFRDGKYVEQYGVADSINQIKDFYKDQLRDPANNFIIAVTPVFQDKNNKGKGGGWRWHKWGQYIGKLTSQCEYLDDEEFGEDFEYILTFHLYSVKGIKWTEEHLNCT